MKIRYRNRLDTRISLGINIPFVVIIAVMGIASLYLLEKEIGSMVARNRQNILTSSLQMVENEINSAVKNHLRAVAEKSREIFAFYHEKAQRGEISREEAEAAVRDIILDKGYGKIGLTGYLAGVTTKGILAIHPLSEGADASGHEFMQKAMAMRNGYLEYEWKNQGEEVARTKAGYLSYFSPWDIMVWASSYKEEFSSLLDQTSIRETIESVKVGKAGFLILMDRSGRIIAGGDHFLKLFGQSPEEMKTASLAMDKLIEAVQEGEGEYHYETPQGEIASLYADVPGIDWVIMVHDLTREFRQVLDSFRTMIIVTIIVAALFVSIFIRVLMKKLLAPMGNIQSVTEEVSAGDLSRRITVTSQDEMGELSRCFNEVVDSFAILVENIQDATHILLESTHSLGASAQEISSTANQQAASVKEILSTMEDSDKLSKGVATKIQEVVKIANATRESVEKGFTLIQESLDKMDEIRQTNGNTIGGIKTLGGQIDSIWEIVNIINGIADQTKIIAFNAELEASAAGDAGKNFQIVAGEIRRLADSTVDSTNEIKAKIHEIQQASDKLIIASEEGTQRIKEGWDISHNIRGVFEDVLSSSEISAASADDIARSIRMQVSSFEQIFLTLKQISEGIDNFVVSTGATSEASDQLKEIADQFDHSISRYSLSGVAPSGQGKEVGEPSANGGERHGE